MGLWQREGVTGHFSGVCACDRLIQHSNMSSAVRRPPVEARASWRRPLQRAGLYKHEWRKTTPHQPSLYMTVLINNSISALKWTESDSLHKNLNSIIISSPSSHSKPLWLILCSIESKRWQYFHFWMKCLLRQLAVFSSILLELILLSCFTSTSFYTALFCLSHSIVLLHSILWHILLYSFLNNSFLCHSIAFYVVLYPFCYVWHFLL